MKNYLPLFCLIILASVIFSCKKSRKDTIDKPECYFDCPIDFNLIDYQAAWSPDNKYIAYYHIDREPAKNGIYLITPDGKENRLWHSGAGAETPSWSPDGKWIAFSYGAQIWKKKLNGDSLTQVTNTGRNFFPAWSPDGKWIAYDNTDCGSVVSPAPTNSCGILITNAFERKLVVSGRIPVWITNSSFAYLGLHYEIFRFDLTNSSKTKLTSLNASDSYNYTIYSLKYSKSEKYLYTAQQKNSFPQICVMNADGTGAKQLTQTGGYTSDWSPDGRSIVYTDSRAVNGRLWIMDADGSNKRQLTF